MGWPSEPAVASAGLLEATDMAREKRNTDMFKSGTRKRNTAMTRAATALAVSRVEPAVTPSSSPRPEQPHRALGAAPDNAHLSPRLVEIAERNVERQRQTFVLGAVGQARTALERGDSLFQFPIHVEGHNTVVPAVVDDSRRTTRDPNEILNAVANQGWRLVSASFVAHDQPVELPGQRGNLQAPAPRRQRQRTTTGYYVFARLRPWSQT